MEIRQGVASELSTPTPALAQMRAMGCSMALLAVLAVNFLYTDGHDAQRCVELIFFGGFVLSCAIGTRLRAALSVAAPLRWPLAAMLGLGCISASLALVPRFAFYEVSSLALLVVLALVISLEVAKGPKNNAVFLCQAIGFVCLAYAFRILLAYVAAYIPNAPTGALGLTPGFSNYRFFNHVQTMTLPLLVLLAVVLPPGRMRWLWFFLAASWWALIYLSAARGSFGGIAAGCAVALALRQRHAIRYLKWMAASALAGVAIYAIAFTVLPAVAGLAPFGEFSRVVERTAADPGSGRWPLWTTSLALAFAHPWLGVGPLHFAHYGIVVHNAAHPHNWALQVLAEWGIPAFACLLLVIARAGRGLLRTARHIADADRRNHDILVAMLVAGCAALADGLVSGLIVMPQSQLMIALYLGCAIGWSRSLRPAATVPQAPSRPRSVAAAVFVLALGAGVAAGVWTDFGARLRHEPYQSWPGIEQGRPVALWPRIWLAGFF